MDRTDQKIILYGCGLIGAEALQTFGSDLVMCFCDSRKELAGTEKYGKEVISADELKSVPSDKILIISTSLNIASEIAESLERRGSNIQNRKTGWDFKKTTIGKRQSRHRRS